ncbi:MAG TPA: hypothetical protein VFR17_04360 [Mycobacterium sp.]|nr:hypothetical protein [Mycobacterium sp.]
MTRSTTSAIDARLSETRDDLHRFAIEVRRLAFSFNGAGESQCLDLSERMLAAARRAEGEAPASSAPEASAGTRLRPTAY